MSRQRFDYATASLGDGRVLIEASAGTGKTYTLTGLALRMVLEGHVSALEKLLVVTFTVAATDEIKTRIRRALRETLRVLEGGVLADDTVSGLVATGQAWYEAQGPEEQQEALQRLHDALQHVDEASIYTIHGFCKRVLGQAAFESGTTFDPVLLEEADDMLERAAADFWHRAAYDDALTAALAVEKGWGVESFLAHYKKARRHPETRVVPEAEAVDTVRAAIGGATEVLRACWSRAALDEALAPVAKWNKNAPLDERRDETCESLARYLGGDIIAGLPALFDCTSDAVYGALYKRGKANVAIAHQVSAHPIFQACSRLVQAIDRLEWALLHQFLDDVDRSFEHAKREAQVMTFDDLLRSVWQALKDPRRGDALAASIQERYETALVDEFQDTDPFQYAIFRRAFRGCPLFFVGDPKQAIYSFRGADLFTYLDAQSEVDRQYSLGRNWRSSGRLLKAVEALFKASPHPFLYQGITYDDVEAAGKADDTPLIGDDQGPLVWWHLPGDAFSEKGTINKPVAEDALLLAVQKEVLHLLTSGMRLGNEDVCPKDLAVLVRTNDQATRVQEVLAQVGVTSVVSRSGNILESQELAELEDILCAVMEPRDAALVRVALASELWGGTAQEVLRVSEDDEAWSELGERLWEWRTLWHHRGVARMLHAMIAERGVEERLLQYRDGERRVTNLRHGIELLHEVEESRQLGPEGMLRWLRRRGEETVERERAELRLESDAEAVQVVTVHSSKGLEYEVVFCPFLVEGKPFTKRKNPLVHVDGEVIYDAGSANLDHHVALAEAERVAEDVRLAYVAMTRAKHRCYLAWGDVNQGEASPLAYLLYSGEVDAGDTPAAFVQAVKTHVKGIRDTRGVLDALADPKLMTVRDVRDVLQQDVPLFQQQNTRPRELQARRVPPVFFRQLKAWGIGSFSGWTEDTVDLTQQTRRATGEDGIMAFAAGRTAGSCLHEILRHIDFANVESPEAKEVVTRTLERFGLDRPEVQSQPIDVEEAVCDMLRQLVAAPLPGSNLHLCDVERSSRLDEWSFILPTAGQLTPYELRQAFERHGEGPLRDSYAPRLMTLGMDETDAYVHGTADLVFVHDGKWYLVDWKSNHLGSTPDCYSREAIEAVMFEHHYTLQCHLYTLALHRYLQTRLPAYRYDTHFGGVWYVFLRGVTLTGATGFYYSRPSEALIETLSKQFQGKGEARYA